MAKPKAAANNDASEAAADVENVAAAEPSPWVDMDDVSDTMAASLFVGVTVAAAVLREEEEQGC